MKTANTIKGRHIKITNGKTWIYPKVYSWHIPKSLRDTNIKKGDTVLVRVKGGKEKVLVVDVFREDIEDTGKEYKAVLAKLKDSE